LTLFYVEVDARSAQTCAGVSRLLLVQIRMIDGGPGSSVRCVFGMSTEPMTRSHRHDSINGRGSLVGQSFRLTINPGSPFAFVDLSLLIEDTAQL